MNICKKLAEQGYEIVFPNKALRKKWTGHATDTPRNYSGATANVYWEVD